MNPSGNVAELARRAPAPGPARLTEVGRTTSVSAIAQLEDSPSMGAQVLAAGEPSAAFDAMLWVLANHGHTIVHAEHELAELVEPPEVVLANVGGSVDGATRTTLRAIGETYRAPVVVFHDDLPMEDQRLLARHCSTLLPVDTPPAVVSDEILRLQTAVATDLRATVWGHDQAVAVLLSHGYRVTPVRSFADLAGAPYGAVVIGADASPQVMVDVTRLVRVTVAARRAPVVWQCPVSPAMQLTAARLGATVVERFDDVAATAITSSLRFGAAAAGEAGGPAVVTAARRPAEARAADVMIVDSDVVFGEMFAVALGDRGLGTHVETNGHDALDHLTAAPGALPRVLMIDLDSGGADGRALLATLGPSGLLSHMKVLAMAARASENDLRMALDLGATDVIRKPFPVSLMLHRIVRLLSE